MDPPYENILDPPMSQLSIQQNFDITHGTKWWINRVFEPSEVKITKKYPSSSFTLKVLDIWGMKKVIIVDTKAGSNQRGLCNFLTYFIV